MHANIARANGECHPQHIPISDLSTAFTTPRNQAWLRELRKGYTTFMKAGGGAGNADLNGDAGEALRALKASLDDMMKTGTDDEFEGGVDAAYDGPTHDLSDEDMAQYTPNVEGIPSLNHPPAAAGTVCFTCVVRIHTCTLVYMYYGMLTAACILILETVHRSQMKFIITACL
jgi:hypothetical protein